MNAAIFFALQTTSNIDGRVVSTDGRSQSEASGEELEGTQAFQDLVAAFLSDQQTLDQGRIETADVSQSPQAPPQPSQGEEAPQQEETEAAPAVPTQPSVQDGSARAESQADAAQLAAEAAQSRQSLPTQETPSSSNRTETAAGGAVADTARMGAVASSKPFFEAISSESELPPEARLRFDRTAQSGAEEGQRNGARVDLENAVRQQAAQASVAAGAAAAIKGGQAAQSASVPQEDGTSPSEQVIQNKDARSSAASSAGAQSESLRPNPSASAEPTQAQLRAEEVQRAVGANLAPQQAPKSERPTPTVSAASAEGNQDSKQVRLAASQTGREGGSSQEQSSQQRDNAVDEASLRPASPPRPSPTPAVVESALPDSKFSDILASLQAGVRPSGVDSGVRSVSASSLPADIPGIDSEEVLSQIVGRARLINSNGQSTVEIQLKPDFLGRVRIETTMAADGTLNAKFVVQDPDVRRLMETRMPLLAERLADSGLKVQSIEFQSMPQNDDSLGQSRQEAGSQQQAREELAQGRRGARRRYEQGDEDASQGQAPPGEEHPEEVAAGSLSVVV